METHLNMGQLTRLRMVLGRLGRVLRQQTADGLSYPQISVLFSIERAQPVTAGELAASEGVTAPSVTRTLNELDRNGLIWREPDPDDRRVSLIHLTEAGDRECMRLRRSRDAWLSEHLTKLSPSELDVLVGALPVLEKLCDPELSPNGPRLGGRGAAVPAATEAPSIRRADPVRAREPGRPPR